MADAMTVEDIVELALRSEDFEQFKQRLEDYRRERRKSLIVGNLPEETVAALKDATMSDDIVERLRKAEVAGVLIPCDDLKEAADEIERLTAELKEATEIINLQLRGYRTSKDSVRAFAFVDKHSEG